MSAHHLSLLVTGALLAALLRLGWYLQRGLGGPGRREGDRWVHHALFLGVCVGVGLSGALAWRAGGSGAALLPALALLLSMPRTRPGRADHWQRALLCTAAFGVGAWAVW